MRLLAVLLPVLLLSAGCGDDHGRESPPQASRFEGCTTENFQRTGTPVGTLRAHDDPVRMRLVPHEADRCPDSLISRSGSGVTGGHVGDLDLDPATARVVRTPGRASDLLLVESASGSDGVQAHLFAANGREVRHDDRPLLPAVDTGRRTPVDAACGPGGRLTVVTAKAHQPPGIVLAWDVTRTTYAVEGDLARTVRTSTVARAVADPTLRRRHPELYDGRLLAGC
jgi:hypothetical protein